MAYLSRLELRDRGYWIDFVAIDNTYDGVAIAAGRRLRENAGPVDPNQTGVPRSDVDAHVTPIKKKR
jgi:hypothetical protein